MRQESEFTCGQCGDEFDIFVYWSAHSNYCKAKLNSRRNRRVVNTELRHGLKLALIRAGFVYCFQVRRATDKQLLSADRIGPSALQTIRACVDWAARTSSGDC